MLRDINNSINSHPDFSIAKGKTISTIFSFLDATLPLFKKDLKKGLTHEDDISQECSIFLNREARNSIFMFHFQHKYPGTKRSSDFSIISAEKFASKDPLIVIEAKRLPTPGSGRKKEYVVGSLGALERFKRGFHGNGLPRSAIFAYIQKETFDYWHTEICSWINERINSNTDASITWNYLDLLKYLSSINGLNKYSSVHSRIGSENIELTHYWFYT
jgi:hypothetical protein